MAKVPVLVSVSVDYYSDVRYVSVELLILEIHDAMHVQKDGR